jgi:transcriptional regulator
MRPNPLFASDDPDVVRQLIRENPWATLVSNGPDGLVASHYPVLLDEDAADLTVLTHVGKPDDALHGFGSGREMLLVVQGRHGYISPSWYGDAAPDPVPTWNFTVAHCYGVPEVLAEEENVATLARLTERFERRVEHPRLFDHEHGPQIAKRTVGVRLPVTRFVCKLKMSQNKDPETQRRILAELHGTGPYSDQALAADMERVLAGRLTST